MSGETYTKLLSSITASTVWMEPHPTRIVWITMLAMADHNGNVFASVPGLAHIARVDRQEAEAALRCFLAPDPDSRNPEHEGRRIEPIAGGWRLLNHDRVRETRDPEARREYQREWDRKNRPSGHARQSDSPTQSDKSPTVRQKSDLTDQTRPEQKQSKALVEPAVRLPDRFPEFWSAYPVKQGKQAAWKRWRADKLDAIADTILAHVERMKREDDGWRNGYAPHGSTYLNQARWTDVPKPAPNQQTTRAPSATMNGLMALEGMRDAVATIGSHHGAAEARRLESGPAAGDGRAAGHGDGVDGVLDAVVVGRGA